MVPAPALPRPARAALLAALAAARAAESLGSPPIALKWPNDLVRQDRKAGGVLVESARTPGGDLRLLVGIGANLSLPDEVPVLGGQLPVGDLALDPALRLALARRVADGFVALLARPADAATGEDYRRRSWLTGRRVALTTADGPWEGTVADVSVDGDLLLADGRCLRGEHTTLVAVRDLRAV